MGEEERNKEFFAAGAEGEHNRVTSSYVILTPLLYYPFNQASKMFVFFQMPCSPEYRPPNCCIAYAENFPWGLTLSDGYVFILPFLVKDQGPNQGVFMIRPEQVSMPLYMS